MSVCNQQLCAIYVLSRHSIKELQRQHELDMEQVRQRHNEELQDIKSVHSHTRYSGSCYRKTPLHIHVLILLSLVFLFWCLGD